MRQITAALVGAGMRGTFAYASYALAHPEEMKIVAVAEPDPERRERAKEAHGIPEERCFASWEQLMAEGKLADAILICTQDRMHYEPAVLALRQGYHVLLEKPMSPDPAECLALGRYAEEAGKVMAIGHVLRYTDFYGTIKRMVMDGGIGRLISIQQTENVEHRHQAHSFVRGNWRNSDTSGPMILSKSCHDMDILLWLAGADCTQVSSFGALTHFRSENAPAGAPAYCMDGCPVQDECPYYAPRVYLDPNAPNAELSRAVVSNDPSDEGVLAALERGPYGRCVYRCDNNVVDHQVVNLEFANEVTVSFTMCAFTAEGGRSLKLMGTRGQIRGDMERGEIEWTSFLTGEKETLRITGTGGHFGGDHGIMRDFVRLAAADGRETALTGAAESVQSHLIAFAAEQSRVERRTIAMADYVNELAAGMSGSA